RWRRALVAVWLVRAFPEQRWRFVGPARLQTQGGQRRKLTCRCAYLYLLLLRDWTGSEALRVSTASGSERGFSKSLAPGDSLAPARGTDSKCILLDRLLLLFYRLRFREWFRGHVPLRDGIVGGDFKQRAVGFAAVDIGQPVSRLGGARVAMLGQYNYL